MSDEPARPRPDAPSMPDIAGSLLREIPGLVSDRVHLLALELRRAGLALAQIVVLVAAIVVLAATAWTALWLGAAAALLAAGVPLAGAVAIVVAINLAAAALAARRVGGLAQWLGLPATVRRLTLPDPPPASDPPDPGAAPPGPMT